MLNKKRPRIPGARCCARRRPRDPVGRTTLGDEPCLKGTCSGRVARRKRVVASPPGSHVGLLWEKYKGSRAGWRRPRTLVEHVSSRCRCASGR